MEQREVRLQRGRTEDLQLAEQVVRVVQAGLQLIAQVGLVQMLCQPGPQVAMVFGKPPPSRASADGDNQVAVCIQQAPVQASEVASDAVPEIAPDHIVQPQPGRVEPEVQDQGKIRQPLA
jgi:hypothetical protein